VQLTYDRDQDLRLIMVEPGKPETGRYDEIIVAYQRFLADEHEAAPLGQVFSGAVRINGPPAIAPAAIRAQRARLEARPTRKAA